MASTNINLNMTSVENREYRLGTIIGWDGKASDLIKESAYDERSAKSTVAAQAGPAVSFANCNLRSIKKPCALTPLFSARWVTSRTAL